MVTATVNWLMGEEHLDPAWTFGPEGERFEVEITGDPNCLTTFKKLHPKTIEAGLVRNPGVVATAMHCVNAIPYVCRGRARPADLPGDAPGGRPRRSGPASGPAGTAPPPGMILDRFSVAGKVAIVTGAGLGIGRGIAIGFAEAGADVALAARTESDLEEVAAQVRAARAPGPRRCRPT